MQDNTRKTLEIYWRHMKRYKWSGLAILFSVVGASATNAVLPIYFKKFFDVLAGGQTKEEIAGGLISVLVLILLVSFLGWIFWRICTFSFSYFQSRVIADLANTCFRYLHKHSFSYFNNNFTGSLVKRVSYFTKSL